jgi:hypothetical protein
MRASYCRIALCDCQDYDYPKSLTGHFPLGEHRYQ